MPSVSFDDGRLVHPPYGEFHMNNFAGAGGWLATAGDYVQFMKVMSGTKQEIVPADWLGRFPNAAV